VGNASVGLLASALVSAAVQAVQLRRWVWAPASIVAPVVGLGLFAGTAAAVGALFPAESVESLALDQVAAGVIVAGFAAPALEALAQRATLGDRAPQGFVGSVALGSYVALGVGVLAVLGLWNLDLTALMAWSPSLHPANVGAIVVSGAVGGLRAGWLGAQVPPDAG
jgi:hypothetical protein